jgi:hypothetical protein
VNLLHSAWFAVGLRKAVIWLVIAVLALLVLGMVGDLSVWLAIPASWKLGTWANKAYQALTD